MMMQEAGYRNIYAMGKSVKQGPYYAQGQVIQSRRKQLRFSQGTLAERYGGQQSYISEIERGWVNFAGADAEWFERMASALELTAEDLLAILGVKYVIASRPNVTENPKISESKEPEEYASIIIRVQKSGSPVGGTVTHEKVAVSHEIARQQGVAGLRVASSTVDVAPLGALAIYSEVAPERDQVVVIEFEQALHLAYYVGEGYVATDSAIERRTPLEFKPDKIVGVVQMFALENPRRRLQKLTN